MPTISMFYGIIVRMYSEPGSPHHEPHVHVEYAGHKAVVALDGHIIAGEFPDNKLKMVQVWMDIHKEDLEANWNLLYSGEPAFKIEPLRRGDIMTPQAVKVIPLEDHLLQIEFSNGEIRVFDVKPLIRGSWMGELSDPAYFKTVRIGGLSVEWPHEQDICPDQLYECSKPVLSQSAS